MSMFSLIKDQYREARGGSSRFLNIYCDHCGEHLLLYQKDGLGHLKRLYLDRIVAPENLTRLQHKPLETIAPLRCHSCGRLIAIADDYDKEQRKVYLLFSFAVTKRVTKGIYPPSILKIDVE